LPGPQPFEVESPAGGRLFLRNQEEVDLWQEMAESYKLDYRLVRQSELVLLGALLTQALALYRAQQELTGMIPQHDEGGVPTGEYIRKDPKPAERTATQKSIEVASKEIRELEKALGIDKKSRESGGEHTVASYIATLKKASHRMGVHIFKRVKMYEQFGMDLRWRLRLLRNGDEEDKRYHNISPEEICTWAEGVLAEIETVDKEFAAKQSKLFGGKL
jgi:hypothetical protein